jgi:3',5'-cyclic AMP phosphodiesterase CpdA
MNLLRFFFLADCQLGAYATFSGMTEADVARFAARDMRVEIVPHVEGFEWDAARYAAAIDIANATRPEFVVVGGDMIDDLANAAQLEELMRITARLDADIPIKWVPGNHDIALDATAPTVHDIEKYREIFGPDYYTFDAGPARFIAMNTVVIDHPEHVPAEFDEQLAWLRFELERAHADAVRHTVLFGHHPLFTSHAAEDDTYWNLPRERRRVLLDLIHDHGVKIAFAGHWHRNSLAFDGDFEMVTSGPVGYPLGVDPSGYRVVEVTGERISHRYEPIEMGIVPSSASGENQT